MATENTPYMIIGPGEIIKDEMEEVNWNQKDLAMVMGVSVKTINQILTHKQSITPEIAILLSKAFGPSAEFWLNLDTKYRLRKKSLKSKKREYETENKAKIRMHMPVLEMRKKGWIDFDNSTNSQIKCYKKFWNIDKIDFTVYNDDISLCAKRQKENRDYTKFYLITWLKKARTEAEKIKCCEYDKEKLAALIESISNYTVIDNGEFIFLENLKDCGVKFFMLSHLEKTYLDGATFFDKSNPVIVYTQRRKNKDNFWWTLAHEISHVLLHLDKNSKPILDNLESHGTEKIEIEADNFAGKCLKRDNILKEFGMSKKNLTETRLIDISKKINISPAIILGILQFENLVSYRTKLNKYKKFYLDSINDLYLMG